MKKRDAYIQIAADRLVLAVPGPDGTLRHLSAPITLDQEPGQWVKALSRLSGTLAEMAEQLGAAGAEAHVLYAGPTHAAALESLPVRSAAQAIDAAQLSCMEQVSFTISSAVFAALPIGRDGAGTARRMHVAVAVDRNDVLGVIANLVEEAGLRFASAIPIVAPLMARLGQEALNDTEPMARLYIGEASSLVLISGNRSLLFARRISLGIGSMVGALTRPIRIRAGEEPVALSEHDARGILLTFGIPDQDAIVHDEPEIRGRQVIPVLQPVLQRIVVELRQSLRFSLTEEGARNVPIQCLGPGSRIPGLARVIAEELGVTLASGDHDAHSLSEDANTAAAEQAGTDSIGMLADAVHDRRTLRELALLPASHWRERHRGKLQRWLWAGAAAALMMVAADGFRHQAAVNSLSAQKATTLSHHSQLEAFQRTSALLAGALGEMSRVEQLVSRELRHHFDGYAAMIELSRLTPDSVRLTQITFRQTEGGMGGTISGIALHDDDRQTALKEYVARIRRSPLFDDAVLGNVQVSNEAGRTGERFEATLSLALLPRLEQVAELSELTAHAGRQAGGEP